MEKSNIRYVMKIVDAAMSELTDEEYVDVVRNLVDTKLKNERNMSVWDVLVLQKTMNQNNLYKRKKHKRNLQYFIEIRGIPEDVDRNEFKTRVTNIAQDYEMTYPKKWFFRKNERSAILLYTNERDAEFAETLFYQCLKWNNLKVSQKDNIPSFIRLHNFRASIENSTR